MATPSQPRELYTSEIVNVPPRLVALMAPHRMREFLRRLERELIELDNGGTIMPEVIADRGGVVRDLAWNRRTK